MHIGKECRESQGESEQSSLAGSLACCSQITHTLSSHASTQLPTLNFRTPTFLWVSEAPFLKTLYCVAVCFKEFVMLYLCIELSARTLVVDKARQLLSLHCEGMRVGVYGEGEGERKYFIVLWNFIPR